MKLKITKRSLFWGLLLIALAVLTNFSGAIIFNNAFYFYHYTFSEKEINLGSCKLNLFDGWVLYKHEIDSFRFVRLESNKNRLNFFLAAFKIEEIKDISLVNRNGFSLIGRYKKNKNNMYDSMYYLVDYNLKISFANQKTQNNELINKFTKNLDCPIVKKAGM